jgi:hypothetical protein
LSSNETVEDDGLGNVNLRALLELDEPLRAVVSVDVDEVAVLALEALSVLLGSLDGLEVVLDLDLLNEALLLGVVTAEELRLDHTDTGVRENVLLVGGLDVLVVERLVGLRIDPSDVEGTVLEATLEVLDETHDIGELEGTLDGEGAVRLDLPTGTGRTERSDLSVTGNDNDLLEVNEATELGNLGLGVDGLELGEGEGEVGARGNLDLVVDLLSAGTVSGLEVSGVVLSDGAAGRSGEVELDADVGGEVGKVGELVHATVEL